MRDHALEWLYLELKHAKINLSHAENRRGVTEGELDAIRQKIEMIDYLIGLALKEV